MAVIDTLANIELFTDLTKEDLERLAKVTVVREFKAGDVIVRENESGIAFYVVAKGEVDVVRGLGTANEEVLASIGPDNFFGEMALFDNHMRSASVRAKTDVECLVLTKWDFNAELTTSGCRIAIAMLAVLARRIREHNLHSHTH